jgi:hypothetical protein
VEEVPGNTKDYNWKGILFKVYNTNSVLYSSALKELRANDASTIMPGGSAGSELF